MKENPCVNSFIHKRIHVFFSWFLQCIFLCGSLKRKNQYVLTVHISKKKKRTNCDVMMSIIRLSDFACTHKSYHEKKTKWIKPHCFAGSGILNCSIRYQKPHVYLNSHMIYSIHHWIDKRWNGKQMSSLYIWLFWCVAEKY